MHCQPALATSQVWGQLELRETLSQSEGRRKKRKEKAERERAGDRKKSLEQRRELKTGCCVSLGSSCHTGSQRRKGEGAEPQLLPPGNPGSSAPAALDFASVRHMWFPGHHPQHGAGTSLCPKP